MQRPSSRGGVAAGPMGGMTGMHSMQGGMGQPMRQPASAMMRPGTQMAPGTGMRPGSGRNRGGTAMRQQGIGVGLVTDVKVADRPMTQQGVMGMKTATAGPGRQIYDKSYYMHTLRTKVGELVGEITKFKEEIVKIDTDSHQYSRFEKRYEDLVKQVRDHEGNLADYNLSLDKQRTDTRPEEVQQMYMQLKQQNTVQRTDLDEIFLQKKSAEEEIRKIEEEMQTIRKIAEDRLNELRPEARDEYEALQEENNRLAQEIHRERMNLERVDGRLQAADAELRSDVLRQRALIQQQHLIQLHEQKEKLNEEAQQLQLSIPEQREILTNKVKTENQLITEAERSFDDLKEEIQRYKKQASDMDTDIQERKGETNDQQKYEILFSKDQEMSTFIEGFEESKKQETAQLQQKQASIVDKLQLISKAIARERDVPDHERVKDMTDDLDFKKRQLQNSEITQVRLRAEHDRRSGELEKINSLDNKITSELAQLRTKKEQFEQDMLNKYNHVDQFKQEGSKVVKQLQERRDKLREKNSVQSTGVKDKEIFWKGLAQQLADNPVHTDLENREMKLKSVMKSVYYLKSLVAGKTAECDYNQNKQQVLGIVEDINRYLQTQVTTSYAAGF